MEGNRAQTNPLFGSPNKLKLGLFCLNGTTPQLSRAPEKYIPTWDKSLELMRMIDKAGLEAMVAVSSWRGTIEDPHHLAHHELEPFTWAAALAACSTYPAIISTFQAQLIPPVFIAKAAATIDQISGGRAALNFVAGNMDTIFGQFGAQVEGAEERYAHTAEVVELVKKFWESEAAFDYEGKFCQVRKGISVPKPIQKPGPAIMNAGSSGRGQLFAAQYADMAFTLFNDDGTGWKEAVDQYKSLAQDKFDRELQVWTHGYVVVGDTDEDAQKYLKYYAEDNADLAWIESFVRQIAEGGAQLRPEQIFKMSRNWAAGGGMSLVGSAQTIADKLARLAEAGVSGVLLTSLDPTMMTERFILEVLPLLEADGLRLPFKSSCAH